MSTILIVVIVIVVVLAVAAAVVLPSRMRSQRLRRRFGPEYDRVVDGTGDRSTAEQQLAEREQRHAHYNLRSLSDTARDNYLRRWTVIQERFVDEPASAVGDADQLVTEVMADRGYPTEHFDQQAEDLSVRHADEVARYRAAHALVTHADTASTDDLRRALLDYRDIVQSLAKAGTKGGHDEDRTQGR
ncbi:MAG TPA: hypothetical protein VHF06_05325 [Pseudonocardiaceae bacterium]|nr:hypothetical protein [Pseudonocardiaceae bacterium]